MSEITVRRAVSSDLDAILGLYTELMEGDAWKGPADRQASIPVFTRILLNPKRHLVVAVIDDEPVATADMLIFEDLSFGARPVGIVENVVTSERVRHVGVGRAVMSHLFELARDAGCYAVQLISRPEESAYAFYRGLGMKPIAQGFKIYLEERPVPGSVDVAPEAEYGLDGESDAAEYSEGEYLPEADYLPEDEYVTEADFDPEYEYEDEYAARQWPEDEEMPKVESEQPRSKRRATGLMRSALRGLRP